MKKLKFEWILIFASFAFLSIGFNAAYAAVPQFDTYVADDPDNGDVVLSDGDTVTITFDIPTNATANGAISQAEIDANFTDGVGAPDFGAAYNGVWAPDSMSLTITITDATGGTIAIGVDTILGRGTTTIADADGGNADLISIGGDSATLSGDFGVIAPPPAAGGGGSTPKGGYQPPTMGITKYGQVLVDDGFSYNRKSVDVALMNTHYPLVTTSVGKENVATLKVYSPRGIEKLQHVGLAFGLGKGQIFGESKVVIEWDKKISGQHTTTIVDPENYLDNVKIVTSDGKCREDGNDICFIIKFYHTFRKPLEYNIIGTYIWDDKLSGWQNYYNDGIKIVGDSLDPPAKHLVMYKKDLITITETGKNSAIDENGNTWVFDKSWRIDEIPSPEILEPITSHGYDRNQVQFSSYKMGQELIANNVLNNILDGKTIQNDLADAFSYDIRYIHRSEDMKLQKDIENEKNSAEKWIEDNFIITDEDVFKKHLNIYKNSLN